jgi:anti-sigma factor RsiW
MTCKQAETLIGAHADGEIEVMQDYLIEKHLLGCAGCSATHLGILALRARIRTEVPYFVASPGLQSRVRATIGAVRASAPSQLRPSPTGDRWRWLTGGVFAGCTASVFAWMLGTTVLAWRANEDFAVAAVAAHTRATLGDHLIEIASSDRHTVKPWLSARLDYSPPVQDLANEGFTLVGGRLDYLDRRNIATLVYRYREHTIDVFVRPDASLVPTSALRSVRGFNVACASGRGMEWVAVSDAEPAVVSVFVRRLARNDVFQPGLDAIDRNR